MERGGNDDEGQREGRGGKACGEGGNKKKKVRRRPEGGKKKPSSNLCPT